MIVPYAPEQLPFFELEPAIKKHKQEFDKDQPHYPLTVEVFGADQELIVKQTIDGPFLKTKLETKTEKEWDTPVTIRYSDAHRQRATEVMDFVTVHDFDQLRIASGTYVLWNDASKQGRWVLLPRNDAAAHYAENELGSLWKKHKDGKSFVFTQESCQLETVLKQLDDCGITETMIDVLKSPE